MRGRVPGWAAACVLVLSLAARSQDIGAPMPSARPPSQARPSAERVATTASTEVPLEHWSYLVVERLASQGTIQSVFLSHKPWTRAEFARLIQEGTDWEHDGSCTAASGCSAELQALKQEYGPEIAALDGALAPEAKIEEIYVRVGGIGGQPVTDGYHFSQTLANDMGRPYGEGFNGIVGARLRAAWGRFAFYLQGEFQAAPRTPALPGATLAQIAAFDGVPAATPVASPALFRPKLQDAYVVFDIAGTQVSVGRQSLWWGNSRSGALMLSNNAEPITMLRVKRRHPVKLPSILGFLGPVQAEFFLGQLAGHRFIDGAPIPAHGTQPFIHGQRFSFKPTPNLEFGVSRTGIFAGHGYPFTASSLGRSLFSVRNPSSASEPGDRRSGFDFRYRIPGLRQWLVLYNDAFTEDEYSPIGYPRRSAMNPGLHLVKMPGWHRLDLRVEGMYTNLPGLRGAGVYYFNSRYRSGYTNEGKLLGSWIGRQGHGLQAWSTYHFSPTNTVTIGFRSATVDKSFVGGGNLRDFSGRWDWQLDRQIGLMVFVQAERTNFPVLSGSPRRNVAAQLQFSYRPKSRTQ